jgi:hypothetical protein
LAHLTEIGQTSLDATLAQVSQPGENVNRPIWLCEKSECVPDSQGLISQHHNQIRAISALKPDFPSLDLRKDFPGVL